MTLAVHSFSRQPSWVIGSAASVVLRPGPAASASLLTTLFPVHTVLCFGCIKNHSFQFFVGVNKRNVATFGPYLVVCNWLRHCSQHAGGICFELVAYLSGCCCGSHNDMDMIRSNGNRKKIPTTDCGMFTNNPLDCFSLFIGEQYRLLLQSIPGPRF